MTIMLIKIELKAYPSLFDPLRWALRTQQADMGRSPDPTALQAIEDDPGLSWGFLP